MSSTQTTIDSTETTSGPNPSSLALTIAYHPNIDRVGQRVIMTASMALSRDAPVFSALDGSAGQPLADEHLSRTPIHITSAANGSVRIDVGQSQMKLSIAGQRITGRMTLTSKDIDRGVVLLLGNRIVLVLHRTEQRGRASGVAADLIGESDGICQVLWDIKSVAGLDRHVLIRGETGTGKELVAKAIHQLSPRRKKGFVPVNLPAIPTSLAAAELFGSKKGAFTGAVRRAGYFEKADGGTLFLDEIGDAHLELQLQLYRALDNGEIQPLGAEDPIKNIDARIVAATDANLENKVNEGSFRAALLNRLATYEIWIPALRERREDIGRLLVSFLRKELEDIPELHRRVYADAAAKPWLPAAIVADLVEFDWPGNVRQLKNAVRQLVIGNRERPYAEKTPQIERILRSKNSEYHIALEENSSSDSSDSPESGDTTNETSGHGGDAAESPNNGSPKTARRKPADVTEDELREALHECRWELNATAAKLGIARGSIYTLPQRFPWFRTAGLLTVEEIKECFDACDGDSARMAEKLEVSETALIRRINELGLQKNGS